MSNFIHRYVLWPGLFLLLLFYLFFVTISWKRQCKSIADVFTLESISEYLWSLFKFFGKLALLICHILLLLLLFDFSFLRFSSVQFSHSVLSHSATPWITALQASLYITNSQSLFKLMSTELVMPSSHFILCRLFLLLPPIPPSIRVFSNESTLCMRWTKYWSFSFSISPSNEHPGWTGWISLQTKGLSRVFSNTTVSKHQFFGAQLSSQSNSNIHTWPLEKT